MCAHRTHLFPVTGEQLNVVTIEMAGNRKGDFSAANKKAKLEGLLVAQSRASNQSSKGYTWRHRDDFQAPPPNPPYGTCTMELVSTDAYEDTFVHRGTCDQCNRRYPQPIGSLLAKNCIHNEHTLYGT